ncbi:little elongation complex subunit 2-like, partial [Ascaphus truei]|uniref:little elongation complex subunit 2-like n=1 Tax=Ascaphus truei TaxID=8439 RepID=UPI003F599818
TLPRKVEPSDDPEIDSEYDLTHLETFGSSENPAKVSKSEGSRKSMLDGATIEKRVIGTTNSDKRDAKEVETSRPTPGCSKMDPPTRAARLLWSDTDDTSSFEGFESDEIKDSDVGKESSEDGTRTASDNENKTELNSVSEAERLPKGARAMSTKRPHTAPHYESDSDEDRLVIDVECKSHKPCSDAVAPLPGALPSPTRTREPSSCRARRAPGQPPKKISREFDPVGAILKMQAQLLKPGAKKVQEQSVASPERTGLASQILTSPPFKPSPSPDPAQGVPREMESSVPPHTRAKQSLLPSELLSCTEDATEYVAPQDGNSAYRLFSLGDLLLLIRSSVQKAHSKVRAQKTGTRQHLPVYILPKVDYQACYGAESLTDSESCRLWTESLLHSKCSYYIGHIDAFTSKLFMLEEMTSEGLKERIHHFKPANSLNILRHILKWVTGLQEGSYLLSHVSGDSSVYLYKSFSGKNTRGAYNLHSAHRGPPGVPSTLSVPWVPLDPSLLLPYHIHHGRPPCTFPPRPHENPAPAKVSACRANPRQTPGHANPPTTDAPFQSPTGKGAAKRKKKNKGKKALKWKAKFQCKNQAAAQT